MQEAARKKPIPTAFVTFNDHRTQTVASTSMMHHDQRYWTTSAAPTPKVRSNLPTSPCRGCTKSGWAAALRALVTRSAGRTARSIG